MSNRLTIKDIARLSGVGKSTVSRVLNNEGHVSDHTRERVLEVINQHSFSPSKSARAMRGQSDKVVAIIISRLDSPSENQALRAMLPLFYEQGYDPIVMESQFSSKRVGEHLKVLHQRSVDGIVLFGFTDLDVEQLMPWQDKMVVMAREYPGLSSVCYDDAGAVSLLLNKLYEKGQRHISYVGVDAKDATTGKLRSQSYLDFCQQHNLTPAIALGELSYHSGFRLASQVLSPQTDAIVCASDTIALGVTKYLQEQQASDVRVVGIGNNPLLKFLFPKSFSIDLGYEQAGSAAARLLLEQVLRSAAPQRIIIPSKLAD